MTGCRIRPYASGTIASGTRVVVATAGRRDLRGRAGRAVRSVPPKPRRPADPTEALERHLARIGRLTRDELDRLALAESPPIAFVATIARFLSPDRLAAVEAVERRVAAALPPKSRWDAPTRDAIVAYAHELILGPFLDEHLSEPFRERVRERLARGWEAAVDQPRYGPNTVAVSAALERLRAMPPGRRAQLVVEATGLRAASPAGLRADMPWPAGLSANDDDALRVSSALAQSDAVAIVGDPAPAIARRSLARAMHGLVLRHAFKPAELDRLVGPWREVLLERPVHRSAEGPHGYLSGHLNMRSRGIVASSTIRFLVFDGRSGQRPGPNR